MVRPNFQDTPANKLLRQLVDPAGRILELGTRRWGSEPTHHKHWLPDAQWTLSDAMAGQDVDVVADAHWLTAESWEPFDAVIAFSVFEHLERPWVAATEIGHILKPGGLVYIATHQTFPLHGYPNDYFRFSKEALCSLFEPDFETVARGYSLPCRIVPPDQVTVWDRFAEAYLSVEYLGRRK